MMARSASGSTGVVTAEELLVRSGSGVGEVTLASLVTVPVVDAFTVTWMYTLAPAPARTVPRSHVTVPAALVQGPPCVGVAPTKVTLSGRVSVTTTDLASEGPWLTTESVYVAGRPASNGLGLADLVISTSALVSTFVVALSWFVVRVGVRRLRRHDRIVSDGPGRGRGARPWPRW